MKLKNIFSTTWSLPVILAFSSMFGLLSALIGDYIWDILSWTTLGIPLIIICWSLLKPAKQVK